MASQGTVLVRAFASDAQLPLSGVPVTFTDETGNILSVRLTDSSGRTQPLAIPTPDASQSLRPGSVRKPYTIIQIRLDHPGFQSVLLEGVQVFPDVQTIQTVQMVPLPEMPTRPPIIIEEPEQNL